MPHAEVNGQRIFFEDTGGDGPPVILAHGIPMDPMRDTWLAAAPVNAAIREFLAGLPD